MKRTHLFLTCIVAIALPAMAPGADVQTISRGERVNVKQHLAPEKLTLIDFYADWCGPCRALAPILDRLAEEHADRFALRKIDITKGGSPAGAQYGVSAIPHLLLFDESGTLISEGGAGPVLQELERRLGIAGGGSFAGGRSRGHKASSPVVPIAMLALVVVGVVLYLRRNHATAAANPPTSVGGGVHSGSAAPDEAGWFAMIQNSLEGPFTHDQLEQMLDRRVLADDARVRRRGDAQWQRLDDVVRL